MPLVKNLPMLGSGILVYFNGKRFPENFADKMFRVVATQQIPVSIVRYIDKGSYEDILLSDVGLYPESYETLYELRFGLDGNGNGILYVKYPTTSYYNTLEDPKWQTNLSDPTKRYIGGYPEREIPSNVFPPRLIEYTVKSFDEILYEIYNDGDEADKFILNCIVNRCLIKEVDKGKVEEVMSNMEYYVSSGALRIIDHPSLMRWEVANG